SIRRHTRFPRDWSSDVCSSDLTRATTKRQITAISLRSSTGHTAQHFTTQVIGFKLHTMATPVRCIITTRCVVCTCVCVCYGCGRDRKSVVEGKSVDHCGGDDTQ